MIVNGLDPIAELLAGHLTFGEIAPRTRSDAVGEGVTQGGIDPVYTMGEVLPGEILMRGPKPRRRTTVMTREFDQSDKLGLRQIEDKAAIASGTAAMREQIVQMGALIWDGDSSFRATTARIGATRKSIRRSDDPLPAIAQGNPGEVAVRVALARGLLDDQLTEATAEQIMAEVTAISRTGNESTHSSGPINDTA